MSEKLTRDQAQVLGEELRSLLRTACERMELAGAFRRCEPVVSRVVVVALGRRELEHDLFGGATGIRDLLEDRLADLVSQGVLRLRARSQSHGDAPTPRRYLFRGIAVDLYVVPHRLQWGFVLAYATGPVAFSRRLMQPRRRGGLLWDWLQVKDGALLEGGQRQYASVPEEADLFALLRLPFREPDRRGELGQPFVLGVPA
jgi:DNA polymerase/3'-5' exonuclease PolX